ncbi:hypothetical protein KAX02_08020 [candidate division WOR-3 bacterium]|nr:hypothetical protein [candidate division WOR-3 bacterium]
MKIEVDVEALLCLLKNEAEYTRNKKEHYLPLPVDELNGEGLTKEDVYTKGWKTGYWQGAECVICNLRNLVDE